MSLVDTAVSSQPSAPAPSGGSPGLGLGRLDRLLAEPGVTEVMVNAGPVWVERAGRLERLPFELGVRALAPRRPPGRPGRHPRRPRLPAGRRAAAGWLPGQHRGAPRCSRRTLRHHPPLRAFAAPGWRTSPTPHRERLADAVRARRNLVVVGGTGSGKTTLLNALAGCIPPAERIVTVEDTAELALEHPHVVRLEARRANSDGVGEVPIRRLVTNALRMRPDRIVVGEVRGAEVLDMAQAMNCGHEGSLSTCHANSPDDALRRLEAMALLAGGDLPLAFVRHQLACAVHLLVQVARCADGRRRVGAVVELGGDDRAARSSRWPRG